MQALFYMDVRQQETPENVELFCRSYHPSQKALPFFLELVRGVTQSRRQIDEIIENRSSHWKLSRMSSVDRNILRIAVFELIFRPDIPAKVTINEAIDVGKKFGTEESGAFINGILDSIRLALERGEISIESGSPGTGEPSTGEGHGDS